MVGQGSNTLIKSVFNQPNNNSKKKPQNSKPKHPWMSKLSSAHLLWTSLQYTPNSSWTEWQVRDGTGSPGEKIKAVLLQQIKESHKKRNLEGTLCNLYNVYVLPCTPATNTKKKVLTENCGWKIKIFKKLWKKRLD